MYTLWRCSAMDPLTWRVPILPLNLSSKSGSGSTGVRRGRCPEHQRKLFQVQNGQMLISLSHQFIFVANLKSASSSIERALGPDAEFRAIKTNWGKHDDLSTISKKFKWIKRYVPAQDFFIFGVMRDPVDFILSLYNFHTRSTF